MKLVFPKPGVDYPEPLDMRVLRRTLPPEDLPVVRTYTALFPDVDAGTLAIDFVVHGDEGVAGPWARAAAPGDVLLANGPGGAYRPDPDADWHLLVGDESAVPAITAALAVLPEDAVTRVVVLVDSPADEPDLPVPAKGELVFVHRSAGGGDGALLAAVQALDWPAGRVHVFAHGEAQEIMHRRAAVPVRRARTGPRPGLGVRLLAPGPHRGRVPGVEVRPRPPGGRRARLTVLVECAACRRVCRGRATRGSPVA